MPRGNLEATASTGEMHPMTGRGERADPRGTDEELRYLIRQQRRIILEARTVSVTLQSALRQLEGVHPVLSVDDRIVLRRQWCERASSLLLEVRAHSARIAAVTEQVATRLGSPRQRGEMLRLREAMRIADGTIAASGEALDEAREQLSA